MFSKSHSLYLVKNKTERRINYKLFICKIYKNDCMYLSGSLNTMKVIKTNCIDIHVNA